MVNLEITRLKIFKTIADKNMINPGDTVVVGFSGGADSMCLLHFLNEYSKKENFKVIAAHVNHCLRGNESERDENFVRDFCDRENIRLEVLKIDVKALSQEKKQGTEECARYLRYNFFREIGKGSTFKIATAHTLSDSLETALFNLTRGSGALGICGIPPVRGNIIRPLIKVTRQEIENYCLSFGLSFVTDSTNLKRDYHRNKIRLDVIPVLKEINPAVENAFLRFSEVLTEDQNYINSKAKEAFNATMVAENEYDIERVKNLPRVIKSRVIFMAISKIMEKVPEYRHIKLIENIIEDSKGAVNLGKDIYIKVVDQRLIFQKKTEEKEKFTKWEEDLKINTVLLKDDKKISINLISKPEYLEKIKIHRNFLNNALDYDIIKNGIKIRTRREGDFFRIKNRGVTKSLKKLFNESKIPQKERETRVILAQDKEVLWIEGFGVGEKAKVTEKTNQVIIINVEENFNVKRHRESIIE